MIYEEIPILQPNEQELIFIFKKKKYPIYKGIFYSYSQKFQCTPDIQQLKEYNADFDVSEKSFSDFILACQGHSFRITEENIFDLQFLSSFWDVTDLITRINKIIENDPTGLLFLNSIIYKIQKNIITENDENILAANFDKYIDDDRILTFPICILKRIVNSPSFIYSTKLDRNQKLVFLKKCLLFHGKEASSIFLDLISTQLSHQDIKNSLVSDKTNQKIEDLNEEGAENSNINSFENTESDKIFIDNEDEKSHQILSKIGEGEFTISFKVYDVKARQLMLKKIIKMILNDDTRFIVLKNTLKEFEILYKLDHPCICKFIGINFLENFNDSGIILDKKDEKTTIALFFEFLEFNLYDCMKFLNNTLKTKIVIEIVHAMNYIHKHGMIHRNLTIDNIRLNKDFEAKIIGFNLIKIYEFIPEIMVYPDETMTKKVGSLGYMSPEMLNEEEYDYKTDVYSFGVVLNMIFVGSLPMKIDGEKAKLPNPSSSISQCCIDIISNCLMHEPSKRPSFEEILQKIRENSYSLASDVDNKIVSQRDQELQHFGE